MPLPKPKPDEEHDEFMERCMADEVMQEEHPDEDQRYAVCETQWEAERAAYTCECIDCGKIVQTDEHCRDIECPECGGQMRRKERPGPGRADANEPERRFSASPQAPVSLKRSDKGQKIVGLAAVYYDGTPETEYELFPGVRERIKRGAFSAVLKEGKETLGLFNHAPDNVLGNTTAKTLKLRSTIKGLQYEIDPPDTQMGRDVVKLLERRDVTGSSFSFLIAEAGDNWKQEGDDEIREIKKVARLFDVGPVTFPAYEATLADLRSVQKRKEALTAQPPDKQAQDDARFARHQEMKAKAVTDADHLG